ncbi:MAG TPA: MauE/DoxX family redox-associated membrane protein [Ignavibacteriaceae bacterium]|nr:MauE/DoxX family redox-associated membrane protein [Ignavibacteriaceae bacterium]
MKKFFGNKYLLLTIRVILGFLFIFSALTKMTDLDYFVKSIQNYKILPDESLNLFALIIPWMEIIIGIFLLVGLFVKESALLGSLLMVVFIAAIIIALARGLNIDCGCFGTADGSKVGVQKLLEDFIILLGFILLTINGSYYLSILKDKTETPPQLPF